MSAYNKLWGMMIGGGVGYLLVFFAMKFPGLATCTDISVPATCSAFGMTYANLVALAMYVAGMIGVHQASPNAK